MKYISKILLLFLLCSLSVLFGCTSELKNNSIDDFNFKNGKLIKYLGTDEVVVIPSSYEENGERIDVVEISSKAFLDNTFIKKVVLSKNIKLIGDNAFDSCLRLKKIIFKMWGI